MNIKTVVIFFFICFTTAQVSAQLIAEERLSAAQLEAFRDEANKKTNALSNYISIIGDKSINQDIRLKSIDLAVKLFVDKDRIVQVSSKNSDKIKTYKIGEYLNRLRVLPYKKVEIRWFDISYVSDYKYGTDGKYYAVATIFQKFRGYDAEGKLLYEDITQKDIEIVMEKQTKKVGDIEKSEWNVLLNQISVIETK